MNKNVTLFIASNTGSPVKQITVSRTIMASLCLLSLGCLILSGFLFFDYLHLKQTSFRAQVLEDKITNQKEEITSQRKQIQMFATEINTYKSKLLSLNNFEKKIRIIANIEKTSEQDNVFGVGGSVPDDLNANTLLTQKHNSLLREMHEQVESLEVSTKKQEEGFETLLKYLDDQRNLLASTPAICPTKGWVTSRFGYRKSPFTGRREFHRGLDIASREGTPVVASADGIITFVGKKGFLGKIVAIDHGHGIVSRYAHLSKALTKRGKVVKRGDTIGQIGSTGRSTGPHLHYDIRLNGVHLNPEKYIIN